MNLSLKSTKIIVAHVQTVKKIHYQGCRVEGMPYAQIVATKTRAVMIKLNYAV